MNKLTKSLCVVIISVLMTGCASLRKAELASGNDPEQAVVEVTQVMSSAQQEQLDVLADEEFERW